MAMRLTKDKTIRVVGLALIGLSAICATGVYALEKAVPTERPSAQSQARVQAHPLTPAPEEAAPTVLTPTATVQPPATHASSHDETAAPKTTPLAQPDTGKTRPAVADKAANPAKQVALTFDDGPDTSFTPQVLDILKAHGIHATFFVVGTQVVKHPDVMKRIHDEGHSIGNHSWDHANMSKQSMASVKREMSATDAAIEKTLGFRPQLFRAPYGAVSKTVRSALAESGRPLVGWTVDTRDWSGTPAEDIVATVQDRIQPGGIILMHSFGGKNGDLGNTVKALPQVIALLQQSGYSFVTVPELAHT